MMEKQTFKTSLAPDLVVSSVLGNLQVKGWNQAEVQVKADAEDLDLQEQDNALQLSCRGDCFIRVPAEAAIEVAQVEGEGRFKMLEDGLNIQQIRGSLILREVGSVRVEMVDGDLDADQIDGDLSSECVKGNAVVRGLQGGFRAAAINGHLDLHSAASAQVDVVDGNLSARQISGDLRFNRVKGNASVRSVQGSFRVGTIDGNLKLRSVEGDISAVTNGNASLRFESLLGTSYQLSARGNAEVRLPPDADVTVNLYSRANSIRLELPQGVKIVQNQRYETVLGNGAARLEIAADGAIVLVCRETAWEESDETDESVAVASAEFSQQFAQQIEAQVDTITRQVNEQLAGLSATISAAGLTPEQTEELMRQARESGARATAKAQEKMQRAQERLEHKLEAARRRNEIRAQAAERRAQGRGRAGWNFEWSSPPVPPSPKEPEPVSDEERLMILRMLEQKKISLEEAEQLLAALEDK